ncbi:MAG: flagellar hook protein FlgE [Nitrospinae bacterium]|nr:flagellar hook protein FlgE [Nitrospinota bacterium]
MIEGLGSALSGLRAYVNNTRVTANNIANLNTTAFSPSRTVNQSLPGGMGVYTASTQTVHSQGAITYTGASLDMAISGSGYFKAVGPNGQTGYTRGGDFKIDSRGRLADSNGNLIQGYSYTRDSSGALVRSSQAGDIYISNAQGSPKGSSSFSFGMNLDAQAPVGENFSTTVSAYNSLGESVPITYSFTKTGAGTWDYSATGPAGTTLSGSGAAGTLSFDSAGNLASPASNPSLTITGFPSGADPMTMSWDLNSAGGVKSYASASTVTAVTQDGAPGGQISGLSVGSDGTVSAMINGQSQPVAQVELYNFANPGGLSRGGNNLYFETAASGQPIAGVAASGSFGEIVPGSLEASGVDLGSEMVNLIQAKYGFTAQTKMIQAADEMAGYLLDIKA